MSTTLEQIQYGFDRDSRRTWQKRPLTDTQDLHHDYDSLSQVTGSARGSLNLNTTAISAIPAFAETWNYDPTGNWRGYRTAGANGVPTLEQHRVHDRGNRLTQIEDSNWPLLLDRVGRVRQSAPDATGDWSGRLEITWDAWSRIKVVSSDPSSTFGAYFYDGLHRRIATYETDLVVRHSYYSDAWRPLEERSVAWGGDPDSATPAISYLWGARHRDDLVRRDRAVGGTALNETRYVLMDYFNPSAITDENGVVKERYAFSAFGTRSTLAPDWTARSTSESAFEFAFQGQFIDTESGLYNYGYRYYSPYLGRWTCKDPIAERGGFDLYTVAFNDVVNSGDLYGLFPIMLAPTPLPVPTFAIPIMIPQPLPPVVNPPTPYPYTPTPQPTPYIPPTNPPSTPNPPSTGGQCKDCIPAKGSQLCEVVAPGCRVRGAHSQPGKNSGHVKICGFAELNG